MSHVAATLVVPDVRVGEWSMPWNARDGVGRLGPGIPKSDFWASAKERIDQVGCVYTAQGFEFDYVGVIVGPDLVYRPMAGAASPRPSSPATSSVPYGDGHAINEPTERGGG